MNLFMHFSLTSPHKQESPPKGCHIRFVGTPHPPYSPPAQWVAIYSAAKSKAARQSPTIAVLKPEDEVNSDTYRIRRDVRCERQARHIKRMIDDICVQCNLCMVPIISTKII